MKIIVGVSGGPDSIALLHVLSKLRHRLGLKIYVAHFNHGIRSEAAKDQNFVKTFSKQLNLSFYSKKEKIQKKNKSLEERAREARFAFLCALAKKTNADAIALGHTQNDLAETVLMRIIRGSGLLGLRSILPKRIINKNAIIRPLLCVSRTEVNKYLKKHKLKYCVDKTNSQQDFLRNKIRLTLIPILEKNYNPNIKEILISLSQTSSLDYEYLELQGRKAFKKLSKNSVKLKSVHLNQKNFKNLHPALQRIVVRLSIENVQGSMRRLTLKHILEIEKLLKADSPYGVVSLPQGVEVLKKHQDLLIQKSSH
ncbi:MAG: tRNA lysidine(34) synthetase TilS [Candidatus Aceula meridiana]|nr:tRNA lysidine(34) synthetase TilS [Candidatus Aceula meridiana]